jgi:uncharacterized protein (DUF736 family)
LIQLIGAYMTELQKDNRGALFPNTNKTKPTQPDMTGSGVIKGVEQRISAWENTSPKGVKYLSLIFSDPLPNNGSNTPRTASTGNNSSSSQDTPKTTTAAPISDDLDDLDAILKSTDDENPFG